MVDGLLKNLLGGDDDDSRNKAQDFVSRYDQGSPYDNISGDEALQHYDRIAGQLSPDQYQEAAMEAFQRMSPEERQQFGQLIAQHNEQAGLPVSQGMRFDDPGDLARLTSQTQQNQPNGLSGMLSGLAGGGGGGLGGLLGGGGLGGLLGGNSGGGAGGMLGGLTGGNQQGGSGAGDLMGNPIVKAVLGGIAATAMKRMMGGR
ncbi:MAG TPA: hypothetical protein VGT61_12265 [Thermomicrobiales bacterium]|jgi:hypothetical protein|nr:hypothetical protein [Thermomicrobiales bacterium]